MRCLEGIGRTSANLAIMAKVLIALLIPPLLAAVPGFAAWFGLRPEVTPALRQRIVADLVAK